MALSDLLDLADLIDDLRSWRAFVPIVIGACAAIWLYASLDGSPLGAALAVVVGLAGLAVGVLWQRRHERLG